MTAIKVLVEMMVSVFLALHCVRKECSGRNVHIPSGFGQRGGPFRLQIPHKSVFKILCVTKKILLTEGNLKASPGKQLLFNYGKDVF